MVVGVYQLSISFPLLLIMLPKNIINPYLLKLVDRLEDLIRDQKKNIQLHWPGIEPGPPAWQARILPLNHQCLLASFLL